MPEPRLRLLTNDELPPEVAARLRPDEESDVARIFNHNPEVFRAWNGFYRTIMRDGTISMKLKEMMRLRIARLNECAV